ncbi:hypothetical protein L1049_006931 [Liquidambar formosana]|uniref:Uncharacterized protein n=1 Tax=Liquidambar formosana TaxID=63359 RepID=A0AAP0WUT1_LIQFO
MSMAPREPPKLGFELLRELLRFRHHFQLVREVAQLVRQASPHRRRPRSRRRCRRRSLCPAAGGDDGMVNVEDRSPAPQLRRTMVLSSWRSSVTSTNSSAEPDSVPGDDPVLTVFPGTVSDAHRRSCLAKPLIDTNIYVYGFSFSD